ncbi:discoidin domain-containing protein [Mesorhizobium carmichaelinearum]|uniref:discoidin domain-containing protein n=1 Tax=Mesorhizobium carmichaelinearum TaxID=1208188 RepID=UPI000BA38CD6|nr:discoidin domain-containing protein [Mesorhizobium carmichaelinearum]
MSPPASASDVTFGAAANAFDGNISTVWRASSATASITYDFGSGKDIQQVVIKAFPTVPSESPKDFTIQYSDDGSIFTTFATVSWSGALPANPIGEARAFSAAGRDVVIGAARYWAVSFADNQAGGGGGMRLVDINYRETSGGSNVSGGTPSVSSAANSTTASMARDANTATVWDSDVPYPVAFYIDWGSSNDKDILEILVQAIHGPKNFNICRSYDAIVYSLVWTPSTQGAWTNLEIKARNDRQSPTPGGHRSRKGRKPLDPPH